MAHALAGCRLYQSKICDSAPWLKQAGSLRMFESYRMRSRSSSPYCERDNRRALKWRLKTLRGGDW